MFLSRLDELGRVPLIALVILGFWFWWPLGLAALGYVAFWRHWQGWGPGRGQWYTATADGAAGAARPAQAGPWGSAGGWRCGNGRGRSASPSGNRAFDDYRAETLRRLEDEQREFVEYLERLRQARDKSEFDAFMAERRNGGPRPAPAEQG